MLPVNDMSEYMGNKKKVQILSIFVCKTVLVKYLTLCNYWWYGTCTVDAQWNIIFELIKI